MSARNNDLQKRFRCYTKAFRVSPEENEIINRKIAVSGLTRQDYLCQSALTHNVTIHGNPYVYVSLKREINHFIEMFKEYKLLDDIPLDEITVLEYILKIVISMKTKKVAQFKVDKVSF